MAKVATVKKIGRQGSTPGNRVVYHVYDANETLEDSDFVFEFSYDPVSSPSTNVTFSPRVIETVMNCGPSAVTVNGIVYETGRWELSLVGGQHFDSDAVSVVFSTPAEGNVYLEIRS